MTGKSRNVSIRADFAAKIRELAAIRCQHNWQVFNLIFNTSDEEILKRMRDGLNVFHEVTVGDFGRITMKIDGETHQRLKNLAESQGYGIGQLITMVLAVPDDVLLDYADEGINRNIQSYQERIGIA